MDLVRGRSGEEQERCEGEGGRDETELRELERERWTEGRREGKVEVGSKVEKDSVKALEREMKRTNGDGE